MRTIKIAGPIVTVLSFVCLAACQTQRPVDSAVGEPPHDYETTSRNALMEVPLFRTHPNMVQYISCGKPIPAYQTTMPLLGGKVVWKGYMVEVNYSVKNVFGASHFAKLSVLYDGDKVNSVVGNASEAGVHLL